MFLLATGFQIDVYRGGIIDKTLIRYHNFLGMSQSLQVGEYQQLSDVHFACDIAVIARTGGLRITLDITGFYGQLIFNAHWSNTEWNGSPVEFDQCRILGRCNR